MKSYMMEGFGHGFHCFIKGALNATNPSAVVDGFEFDILSVIMSFTRILLAFVCAGCCSGQIPLKGIVGVRVATVLAEGNGTGTASEKVLTKYLQLDSSSIQTEAELRLREGGLSVRPSDQETYPALVILVSAAGTQAVSVDIYLLEMASLDRERMRALVRTWQRPAVLQSPSKDTIREAIRDGVSAFLNQWLSDRGK